MIPLGMESELTKPNRQGPRKLVVKVLCHYEPDDGPLSAAQVRQIKAIAPQDTKGAARSSVFGPKPARNK